MKKKLLATVGALALAAAMATSTFAAGFVGSAVGSNKPSAGDVTSSKGYLAEVKDVAADVVTELQGYGSAADMLQKNSINTSTLPAAVQNELSTMSFLTAFDLNAAGSDTFTFRINGIVKGQTYIMLHKRSSSGLWEVVGSGTAAEGGTISGTFDSFSPVVVVVGQAPSAPPAGDTSGSTSGSTSTPSATTPAVVYAPQTGVNFLEYVAALGIAAGLAVLAFAYKKIKE